MQETWDAGSISGSNFWVWNVPWKCMATLSSILGWRIPWTEKPGRLRSIVLWRAGHNWSDLAHTQVHEKRIHLQVKLEQVWKQSWFPCLQYPVKKCVHNLFTFFLYLILALSSGELFSWPSHFQNPFITGLGSGHVLYLASSKILFPSQYQASHL